MNEAVIWLVFIQRPDHPVAISPGLRQFCVVQKTTEAVAVPGDIKPVPSPSFSVMRRLEQFVDDIRDASGETDRLLAVCLFLSCFCSLEEEGQVSYLLKLTFGDLNGRVFNDDL